MCSQSESPTVPSMSGGTQASTGTFVPRKAVTVEELCADWLTSLHNARASTRNGYAFMLAPLHERHGRLPAQRLTRPDLDKLLTDLRDGGTKTAKGNTRGPWSPRSLNAAINAWRLVLGYGCERRELAHNPATAMKKVPRAHTEIQTYTPDEIRAVLRAADKDRNGHLWWLALTRLRRGEIAADCPGPTSTSMPARSPSQTAASSWAAARAPSSKTGRKLWRRGALCRWTTGCWLCCGGPRPAMLPRSLRSVARTDAGYVASNEAGQPYTPGALTHMWRKVTKTAGVQPIRLHEARHSCGTAMHLRGVPDAVIAKWLGHADSSFTSRIYCHSQDEALRDAGKTLGAIVTYS